MREKRKQRGDEGKHIKNANTTNNIATKEEKGRRQSYKKGGWDGMGWDG